MPCPLSLVRLPTLLTSFIHLLPRCLCFLPFFLSFPNPSTSQRMVTKLFTLRIRCLPLAEFDHEPIPIWPQLKKSKHSFFFHCPTQFTLACACLCAQRYPALPVEPFSRCKRWRRKEGVWQDRRRKRGQLFLFCSCSSMKGVSSISLFLAPFRRKRNGLGTVVFRIDLW